MNCLKCPIYWGDKVHECVCEQCADTADLSEVLAEMPPLVCGNEPIEGYHLR